MLLAIFQLEVRGQSLPTMFQHHLLHLPTPPSHVSSFIKGMMQNLHPFSFVFPSTSLILNNSFVCMVGGGNKQRNGLSHIKTSSLFYNCKQPYLEFFGSFDLDTSLILSIKCAKLKYKFSLFFLKFSIFLFSNPVH